MARAHLEGPTLTAGDLAGVDCRALVMMADDTNDPVPTLAPVRRRPPRQTRAAGQASSNASPSGLATTTV
jgi:hypothetical protein